MNISELEQAIKEIEARSQESHEATFALASTDKFILRTDIEKYEELLRDLEAIKQFDKFVAENQSVVDEYRRLEARVGQIKKPAQKVVNRRKNTGTKKKTAAAPEIKAPQIEERKDAVGSEVVLEPEVREQSKAPVVEPEFKMPDFSMIQALPAGREEQPVKKTFEPPVIDLGSYRLKRDNIIQDLPINDKSEQVFKSPGMTAEQIKASQDLINSIPIMSPESVDPIQAEIDRRTKEFDAAKAQPVVESAPEAYKPMSDAEIEASRRKLSESVPAAKPMTPEEIEAARRKIGVEPPKAEPAPAAPEAPKAKKGKRKKVTKRRRFDWKNNFLTNGIKKGYLVVKGLVFAENMNGRTKDYVNLVAQIGAYRSTFKKRSQEVNQIEFEVLDRKISESTMLTVDEKKRLYKKLTALARSVERQNRKIQNKALSDNRGIMDVLDEELGYGRK